MSANGSPDSKLDDSGVQHAIYWECVRRSNIVRFDLSFDGVAAFRAV